MRTWLNTRCLDLEPWEHRCCVAVELDKRRVLYITEGGHILVQNYGDEDINMPFTWELIGDES